VERRKELSILNIDGIRRSLRWWNHFCCL